MEAIDNTNLENHAWNEIQNNYTTIEPFLWKLIQPTQQKQKITITIIKTFILAHKDYILAVGYFGKINTQLQSKINV